MMVEMGDKWVIKCMKNKMEMGEKWVIKVLKYDGENGGQMGDKMYEK